MAVLYLCMSIIIDRHYNIIYCWCDHIDSGYTKRPSIIYAWCDVASYYRSSRFRGMDGVAICIQPCIHHIHGHLRGL